MSADEMRKILKDRYGINSYEELNEAIEKSEGLDVGLFTSPIKKEVEENV